MSQQKSKYTKVTAPLKEIIIKLYDEGKRVKYISETLSLNLFTVKSVILTYKKFGIEPRKRGHRPSKLSIDQRNELKTWVNENCQLTLQDLANRVEEKFEIKVSPTTIFKYLDQLHYSYKRISPVPARRNCEETIEVRFKYAQTFMKKVDQTSTIFIDETGVSLHCRYNPGRSEIGKRANLEVRTIRGKNFSVCAAMSSEGLELYQAQPSAYNSTDFIDFIKKYLDLLPNGSIKKYYLIMDKVRFHHNNEVEQIINQKGHELIFLPPYSPFLNPIENLFNQLKFYINRLSPKDTDEVFRAIEHASEVIAPEDCANYWSNMRKYVLMSLKKIRIEN